MSSKDNNLIFEQYLTISESPVAITAENLSPRETITMKDTSGANVTYVVADDWRPGTGAVNINLVDSGGRTVSYPTADLNAHLAAGTATKAEPTAAPAADAQAPRTAAIGAEPNQPEQAGWATATRNVMGTGPDSGKIGGGLQGAVASKDWLTRGLMGKADQAVQSLGKKAPKRGDAAVAYRQ